MSEMFYLVVVQVVLLFRAKTWVLSVAISRELEGVHVEFLGQVPGQKSKQKKDGTWISATMAKVLTEAGTQTLGAYINKR